MTKPIAYAGCCCSDVLLPLSRSEADAMADAETALWPILELPAEHDSWGSPDAYIELSRSADRFTPEQLSQVLEATTTMKPGEGLFQMIGRCGFLGSYGECTNYSERPNVCRELQQGGRRCNNIVGKAVVQTVTPVAVQRRS